MTDALTTTGVEGEFPPLEAPGLLGEADQRRFEPSVRDRQRDGVGTRLGGGARVLRVGGWRGWPWPARRCWR
jgi:hypothetical protein